MGNRDSVKRKMGKEIWEKDLRKRHEERDMEKEDGKERSTQGNL